MQHRLIGYWTENEDGWLHPSRVVDPDWPAEERERVATYLEAAPFCRHFRGYSPCRICGIPNGSSEHYDGVYVWPQGLAHYVRDHQVRLPDEFLTHVTTQLDSSPDTGEEMPEFDWTQIDYDWWFETMSTKINGC